MSDTSNTTRQQAHLNWDAQGQPLCARFDDLYFSNEDGLAETRYVFLANNQLPERFAALAAGEQLVIGETGFGTGLNFLCAWQLFEQQAAPGARLHFVSVEKYPLSNADLQRALAQHATRASNVAPLTPMGECHNPDCSEDFENDPARLFCGPACAERFEAIHQHRNA